MGEGDSLKKFATAQKAKELLKEFIKEQGTTGKATALCGVCDMVGFSQGKTEILKFLEGTHRINQGVPLQTLERFWRKNVSDFSKHKLTILNKHTSLSMVAVDKILSKINVRLYYLHAKVVSGEF